MSPSGRPTSPGRMHPESGSSRERGSKSFGTNNKENWNNTNSRKSFGTNNKGNWKNASSPTKRHFEILPSLDIIWRGEASPLEQTTWKIETMQVLPQKGNSQCYHLYHNLTNLKTLFRENGESSHQTIFVKSAFDKDFRFSGGDDKFQGFGPTWSVQGCLARCCRQYLGPKYWNNEMVIQQKSGCKRLKVSNLHQ